MTADQKNESKIPGAIARAKSLTPEQRSEIGKKAASKRWGVKPVRVKKRGNFIEHFGVDVDCYVLDDARKTAVISQRGMGEAIGFSRRGERLKGFVDSKTMVSYVGRELRQKLDNPIVFQRVSSAAKNELSAHANGYEASILIDICNAIIEAHKDGRLRGARYQRMIQQAQIINGASAKRGIESLVYALAGYSPTVDEVISAFKVYIQEEARKYEAEFPNELYEQWHKLYRIPVPARGKPWHFKHLTIRHVYYPLAESNGKLLQLMRALKAQGGSKSNKLFQFLNDVGARALRMHLGRILEMCESSDTKEEYEKKILERFGGQMEFDLPIPSDPSTA